MVGGFHRPYGAPDSMLADSQDCVVARPGRQRLHPGLIFLLPFRGALTVRGLRLRGAWTVRGLRLANFTQTLKVRAPSVVSEGLLRGS